MYMNEQQNRPKPKTGRRKKLQVRTSKGTFAPKLTRKQEAWSREYISDPKAPLSDIAKRTYNVTDTDTAYQISRQNLENTRIQIYLNSHIDKAKERIVQLVDSDREDIALRASQDIIDRTHGKPTQIQHSQSVSFIQHLTNKSIDI